MCLPKGKQPSTLFDRLRRKFTRSRNSSFSLSARGSIAELERKREIRVSWRITRPREKRHVSWRNCHPRRSNDSKSYKTESVVRDDGPINGYPSWVSEMKVFSKVLGRTRREGIRGIVELEERKKARRRRAKERISLGETGSQGESSCPSDSPRTWYRRTGPCPFRPFDSDPYWHI